MKNSFVCKVLLLALLCGVSMSHVYAQVPHKTSFQAVIRDADNELVINNTVSFRISILYGSETGASVYTETHTPTTNDNGLATLYIGTGTPVIGSFDSVDWAAGSYYLKAESDPSGGADYSVSLTSQLVSVPFALYAEKSGSSIDSSKWSISGDDIYNSNTGNVGIGTNAPLARLHVADSAVVFTGQESLMIATELPDVVLPVSGGGIRMMWVPGKAAFRVGAVEGFSPDDWDESNIGSFSFASGVSTKATGLMSTSMGYHSVASGDVSLSVGSSTTASGLSSVAMGLSTTASGISSVSIGEGTTASGYNSFSTGMATVASGDMSVAMGEGTEASGVESFAMGGVHTTASGDYSVAMGSVDSAIGVSSFVAGSHSTASGDNSVAIGNYAMASGTTATAIGASIASGASSVAMYGTASGDRSIALPGGNASGNDAVAMSGGVASGNNGVAIGVAATASGANSMAMGSSVSTNEKEGAFAIGDHSGITTTNDTANQMMMRFSGGYKLYSNASATEGVAVTKDGVAKYMNDVTDHFDDRSLVDKHYVDSVTTSGGGESDTNWVVSGDDIYNSNLGKVGIGTSTPMARLHVADSAVVFTGFSGWLGSPTLPGGAPPISGGGVRMMWYPGKAAFRVGGVEGIEFPIAEDRWNESNTGEFSFGAGINTKANGYASVATGHLTTASGDNSTAMGVGTVASGAGSFAVGSVDSAIGAASIALGSYTKARGNYSFAAGLVSTASGDLSFAMGEYVRASGSHSFGFGGYGTTATGDYSVSMGLSDSATGYSAFAAGRLAHASGDFSVAMGGSSGLGQFALASGIGSVAMGYATASGSNSFAIGDGSSASGAGATAMGNGYASGPYSFAIGSSDSAIGNSSIAMGYSSTASGDYSLAVGRVSVASGLYSVALGNTSTASGAAAFASGESSIASGDYSVATGMSDSASGYASIAMGYNSLASGEKSVAIGLEAKSSGLGSVAFGSGISSGNGSVALPGSVASGTMSAGMSGGIANGELSTGVSGGIADGEHSTGVSGGVASAGHAVAIGDGATASGANSMAMGSSVSTNEKEGAFAIGDHSGATTTNDTANQMMMRFSGGYKLYSNASATEGVAITKDGVAKYLNDVTDHFDDRTLVDKHYVDSVATGGGGSDTNWVVSGDDIYNSNSGNVGIGTNAPLAKLHVANGNVVFAVPDPISAPLSVPVSGAGQRMMWYAAGGAFRAGYVTGNQWDVDSVGGLSFATGYDSKATGFASVAMGLNSRAGSLSFAFGTGGNADESSFTFGGGNSYDASYSFGGANASGYSFGFGNTSFAKGSSFAMGDNSYADSTSVAIGSGARASNYGAVALGGDVTNGATATGQNSLANGFDVLASGFNAKAIGFRDTASGFGAIVIGNYSNASGDHSMALGRDVSTNGKEGAFAIGDNSGSVAMNDAANQMMMRFAGGYKLYSNSTLSVGAELAPGANSWSTISDVHKKENFSAVDGEAFLKKITKFKLTSWNYKGQDPTVFRHYGPMAQDFYAAFGKDSLGTIGNDTTINQADMEGVSFIAIQALVKRTEVMIERIEQLEAQNTMLVKETELLKAELNERERDKNKGERQSMKDNPFVQK